MSPVYSQALGKCLRTCLHFSVRPVSRGHEVGTPGHHLSPELPYSQPAVSPLVPGGVLSRLVLWGCVKVAVAHVKFVFPCPLSEPSTWLVFRLASGPLVACCTNAATMPKVPSGGMRRSSAVLSVWIFWAKFHFIYATCCLPWAEEVEDYWVMTGTVNVEKRVSFVNWISTPRKLMG